MYKSPLIAMLTATALVSCSAEEAAPKNAEKIAENTAPPVSFAKKAVALSGTPLINPPTEDARAIAECFNGPADPIEPPPFRGIRINGSVGRPQYHHLQRFKRKMADGKECSITSTFAEGSQREHRWLTVSARVQDRRYDYEHYDSGNKKFSVQSPSYDASLRFTAQGVEGLGGNLATDAYGWTWTSISRQRAMAANGEAVLSVLKNNGRPWVRTLQHPKIDS